MGWFLFPEKCQKTPRHEIDWKKKLRIFIGTAGIQSTDGGSFLRDKDDTSGFRDALLEYANRFWRQHEVDFMGKQAMAMQVIGGAQ